MNIRLTIFAIASATFFPFAPSASGETIAKLKTSSAARVATQIDQHDTDVRALERSFQESMDRLKQAYVQERKAMRKALINSLEKQKTEMTEKGKLDEAVAIRDEINRLRESQISAPLPSSSMLSGTGGILGTWRWNNGVDIKNLSGGQTNGKGTWRLIDPSEQLYEFHWPRIKPDHVRLSPNGRVLEGTKATDRTFRVWAVRID